MFSQHELGIQAQMVAVSCCIVITFLAFIQVRRSGIEPFGSVDDKHWSPFVGAQDNSVNSA